MIREGELEWVFDGIGTHRVKRGDFVCAPIGYLHRIHVVGDAPGHPHAHRAAQRAPPRAGRLRLRPPGPPRLPLTAP